MTTPRGLLLASLLLVALDTQAQAPPQGRLPRVGFCSPGIPEAALVNLAHPIPQALLAGLRERGWHDGKNYQLVFRTAVGRPGGMGACLDSLVAMPVDVIVVPGSHRLALEKTSTIPIVSTMGGVDPSLRGRNVTGASIGLDDELVHKQLALFKEVARVERIVYLVARRPADATPGLVRERPPEFQAAERAVGITVDEWIITAPDQLEPACRAIARGGRSGIFMPNSPVWITWYEDSRKGPTGFADDCSIRHRIPVMGPGATSAAQPGVLLGYGSTFLDALKRLPYFIDRILKGARAQDLPIQRIDDYPLGVNLAVAKKLGIAVAPSILVRAEVVFQEEQTTEPAYRPKAPY